MTPPAVGGPGTIPPPSATIPVRPAGAPPPGTPLGSHYAHCFGCGPQVPGGLHLALTAGEGLTVSAEFQVTAVHQGAPGLAHGGLLACAFDEALGAVTWLARVPAVTAALHTDFRAPVPVGSTLHIVAEVTGVAGRKVYTAATGRLGYPSGRVAVQAAALFVAVPLSHFKEHGRPEDVAAAAAQRDVLAALRDFDVNP